jgi:hypothetical protein
MSHMDAKELARGFSEEAYERYRRLKLATLVYDSNATALEAQLIELAEAGATNDTVEFNRVVSAMDSAGLGPVFEILAEEEPAQVYAMANWHLLDANLWDGFYRILAAEGRTDGAIPDFEHDRKIALEAVHSGRMGE